MTLRHTKERSMIGGIIRLLFFFLILICSSHIDCCAGDSDSTDALRDALENNNATTTEWEVGDHGVRAYYIVPKISSFLSMMGSSAIIAEVWVDRQKHSRRSSPSIGWLLISMSVADIMFSATFFVGNWAVPSDTSHIWQAKGNTATCDAQGFFNQLGWAATPLFSLALSIYFLLIVRYNWKEGELRKMDPWVHGSIWLSSLLMAAIPIPLGLYNAAFEVCWVEAKPYGCSPVDDDFPCTRGQQAASWALAYTIFPGLVCLFLSTIIMTMLYQAVRQMETDRMTNVLRTSAGEELQLNTVDRTRSRKVGIQALYYLAAYYLVTIPEFIAFLLASVNEEWYTYGTDLVVYSILVPLLGFFNFLVFASRRDQMHTSYGRFLSRAVCCFGVTRLVLRQTTTYLSSSAHFMPSRRAVSCTNNDITNRVGETRNQLHEQRPTDRSTQHCGENKETADISSTSV